MFTIMMIIVILLTTLFVVRLININFNEDINSIFSNTVYEIYSNVSKLNRFEGLSSDNKRKVNNYTEELLHLTKRIENMRDKKGYIHIIGIHSSITHLEGRNKEIINLSIKLSCSDNEDMDKIFDDRLLMQTVQNIRLIVYQMEKRYKKITKE